MNKIWLIIKREYLTRVRKKAFLITTFVFPVLMVAIWALPFWLSTQEADEKSIVVVDDSGIFDNQYKTTNNIRFDKSELPLKIAKDQFRKNGYYGLLYIPKLSLEKPKGITLWTENNASFDVQQTIESIIEKRIEGIKLEGAGIDRSVLEKSKTEISLDTLNYDGGREKESNAAIATGASFIFSFIIYFIIFIYGVQVMRGVVEEKTNRIIEVIISSVKPFQLMMGKILGIVAVAFTQIIMWVILTATIAMIVVANISSTTEKQVIEHALKNNAPKETKQEEISLSITKITDSINIPEVLGLFFIYFIGGYLLYSALFAAIGSAIDSETDTQQFMLPVTAPLIISIGLLSIIIKDPHGPLAFWLSIFPLTSPIIMMMRIPFEVPLWQLLLSITLLIGGFLFTTWFAGRIYRVGILMYGKKVNYKELVKWFFVRM